MRVNSLLGELLIGKKLITQAQLQKALAEQKGTKEPLGQILIRLGFLKETELRTVLSEQLGLSFLLPDQLKPRADQRLKELINSEFAREHQVLPLGCEGRVLKVAVSKIPDLIFLDNLRKISGFDIVLVLAMEAEIRAAINQFYGVTEMEEVVSSSALHLASDLYGNDARETERVQLDAGAIGADHAPVVRLVDVLLKKALDDRASDIHIEPFRDSLSIRYRIDGVLYELPPPPKQFHLAVASRIKILARMDIAEKRIPQDGMFSIDYQTRKIDVRVSTVPVICGEKIAMRLLDKRMELLDLNALGFEPEQLAVLEESMRKAYGLIFLTGPTGSGKTTTLYAAINKCLSKAVNILTVEDPVEYQIEGINQLQVKPEIGLTFASGLRAFLRQDPDIIFVGEVRDQETAEICIRAALTGHLVLSTLHTNDAASAVTRLCDIGIKPYLVAASLILVGAQRLARCLCPHCKVPKPVDERMKKDYGIHVDTIYTSRGCEKCRNIGYWGRMAFYEFLPLDEQLRSAITRGADLDEIRRIQREKGYMSLRESAIRKVERGLTSLEEILSIT